MSRVIVTFDIDDDVYKLASERARAELVSPETWIAYTLERAVNLERRRRSPEEK